MGPRASLDARYISSLPGFDPGPSSPQSVAIPTELPGPHYVYKDKGKGHPITGHGYPVGEKSRISL